MDLPVKKPRLEWLDALRGFTMILVVANHVSQMGFEQNWKWSSSLPFLLLFQSRSGVGCPQSGTVARQETEGADYSHCLLLLPVLCHDVAQLCRCRSH